MGLFRPVLSRCAVTVRGAIALAGGTLLSIVAYFENDLAGAVAGPALLIVTGLVTAVSVWAKRRNTQRAMISIAIQSATSRDTYNAPNSAGLLLAGHPITASFTVSGGVIPPTFLMTLDARIVGARADARSTEAGSQPESDNSSKTDSVSISGPAVVAPIALRSIGTHIASGAFPHRGVWEFSGAALTITDPLGLTEAPGFIAATERVLLRVEPQQHLLPWPVISSVERSGDTVQISEERLGARLDLKTYHPADGMRSIAWKIFAKRGELLARHPEAAATPDGTVLMFVAAIRTDDEVAGAAVAYARRCEELGSLVIAGVLGSDRIAMSANQLLDLSIEGAFAANPARLAADLCTFMTNIAQRMPHGRITRIALVTAERGEPDFVTALKRCAETLHSANVVGTLLIAPKTLRSYRLNSAPHIAPAQPFTNIPSTAPSTALTRWFIDQQQTASETANRDATVGGQAVNSLAALRGLEPCGFDGGPR